MRPSWDKYFMDLAKLVKTRSTCLRRQIGAVAVINNRILTTGYNGPPSGCEHCGSNGCIREKMNVPSGERHELCSAIHAEQNAVAQAAYVGLSLKGATMYTTTYPCSICTKLIIASGIKKVVYDFDYPDEHSLAFFHQAKVVIVKYDPTNIY